MPDPTADAATDLADLIGSSGPVVPVPGLTPATAAAVAGVLAGRGVRAAVVDATAADKQTLLTAVATAFAFPGYFGHNWDALLDCLADVASDPDGWAAAVLVGTAALRDRDPDLLADLVDVCRTAADRDRDRGRGVSVRLVLG